MAYYDDIPDQNSGGSPLPWWQDPNSRPPGYSGPWPPPLPPGATYGDQPGQINYGPGSDTTTGNLPPPLPGTPAPTPSPATDPTPPPSGGGGSPAPSGYTYDQLLQKAQAYYQSKYGVPLGGDVVGQISHDLAGQVAPGANNLYGDSDAQKVAAWIDSHAPMQAVHSAPVDTPPPPHDGGPDPTPPPPPNPGPSTNPTTNPTPGAPGTTQGPSPDLPGYTAPAAFKPPPAFSFPDFQAPGTDEVLNDPGYQFTLQQGVDALSRTRAAMGTLNTGGTLKDIVDYGQNLASTRYNDVYQRDFNTYQSNRQNAISAYDTNYNTQYKDPYQINYQSQYVDPFQFDTSTALANYNAQQHNYDQNLGYGLSYAQLGQNQNQFNSTLGLNYAQLGQNQNQFNATLNQNQNQFDANLNQHTVDQNLYYQQHNIDQNQYYGYQNKVFDYNQQRNNLLDQFDMRYKLLGLL